MAFTFEDFFTSGLDFGGLTSGFPAWAFFKGESRVAATGNGASFSACCSTLATILAVFNGLGCSEILSERFWRFFVSLERDDDRDEVL